MMCANEHNHAMVYYHRIVLTEQKEKYMSDETTQQGSPDPSTVLCRVIDVNQAIQDAFQKFIEAEGKSLDELAHALRDELSKMELFAPAPSQTEASSVG